MTKRTLWTAAVLVGVVMIALAALDQLPISDELRAQLRAVLTKALALALGVLALAGAAVAAPWYVGAAIAAAAFVYAGGWDVVSYATGAPSIGGPRMASGGEGGGNAGCGPDGRTPDGVPCVRLGF